MPDKLISEDTSEEIKSFPVSLLEESNEAKITYFKNYTVGHPLLMEAYQKTLDNIFSNSSQNIHFLYGPSGVGKTTIFKKLQRDIVQRMFSVLEKDKGRIPFAALEAPSSDTGSFDWKDFYIRLLEELKEIAIDYKVDYDDLFNNAEFESNFSDPNRKLRNALEKALRNRRLVTLIIDEGQHMMKMASGRKLRSQMDSIKSLASLSRTPILLIGTYELLQFTNLSGQLARRSDDVHFERYKIEKKGDMEKFENVLFMFQKNMPLEVTPDLVNYADYFYERSIGCIGILKDWLVKTLDMKLQKGNKSLLIDDFQEYSLSLDQCIKIIREAREGEMKLEDSEEKKNFLYSLLMANGKPVEDTEEEKIKKEEPQKQNEKQTNKPRGKNRRPGTRNPKRDKVGGKSEEVETKSVEEVG
ncbi:TniB protein [Paenibacillus taihuensis]|uniref:TniB protein n=1 Tax=Paenibacillus taihuensis TaxID=1156355 RepID=A0A3D9RUZ3_9BACL|nr:AAA family ATPase [Paenibacillus taihuensis]REE81561.1 TniB protein [Paenibacillus taihuensis]